MSNRITKHRIEEEIPEQYRNIADRTAQDMVVDHIYAAYSLVKSLHPEVTGLYIKAEETPTGNIITHIDLKTAREL